MSDNLLRRAHASGGDRVRPVKGSWRKSSYSGSNGDCIEVAVLTSNTVGIRDSKAVAGPYLRFPQGVWTTFLGNVRRANTESGNLIL